MTLEHLIELFEENKDCVQAIKMKKYLKNQFEFLGISKPKRAKLESDFIKEVSNYNIDAVMGLVYTLHNMAYREYMYTAQCLCLKKYKNMNIDHIHKMCELTIINSWWENTDGYMATIKRWLKIYPEYIEEFVEMYYKSDNMWLRRLAIICQLSLKEKTNFIVLQKAILYNIDDSEFFIQKAIGWALRDYSKYSAKEVKEFIQLHDNELSKLSKREGSKYL